MKNYWTQPSLSRDFALLSAAVLCVLLMISGWVTYMTYSHYSMRVGVEMEKEATRIERTLDNEMDRANYMLSALGRQIVVEQDRNLTRIAQTLKSFDSKGYIYTIFCWISPDQKIVVSSSHGVLDTPVDSSDRDYVKKAMIEPWKMQIGRPVEGRVSERWIIPVSMGVTDYTGKFIGTVMLSLDINTLTERISNLVKRDGVSFAIASKTLIPLTEVSDDKDFVTHNFPIQKLGNINFSTHPSGLITESTLFMGGGNYSYYRVSADYPYLILVGYDTRIKDVPMRSVLWSFLAQMMMIAVFLISFLWGMRVRMIRPLQELSEVAGAVARGEPYAADSMGGAEIEKMSAQIHRISDYIAETKRIEEELRNKVFLLKKSREHAEMDRRSKSEFLAYICQEMRDPLNNIIGFAQVMRDQLYGPIENRKYRQHAADIYRAGNGMLATLQDMLSVSKAETGYSVLSEKPVDVSVVINKALRFVAERLQLEKLHIKVMLPDPLPKLVSDEFRLQEIIMNLLLYMIEQLPPERTLVMESRLINDNKDFVLRISSDEQPVTAAQLSALAQHLADAPYTGPAGSAAPTDLRLELARTLIGMHQGMLDIRRPSSGHMTVTVIFGFGRVRFS